MRNVRRTRVIAVVAALSITAGAAATAIAATIEPKPQRQRQLREAATAIAKTIAVKPRQVDKAVFQIIPPRGTPAGVVTGNLAGFPLRGKKFGILSNGSVKLADRPNDSPSTSRRNGGPFVRGVRDVTMMRIQLDVPEGASCLSIRFRFLTEEFPEFVGSDFNDFFIAEVDGSTWRAGTNEEPKIVAPDNFAFDGEGNVISVNGAGAATVNKNRAKGTTYDGGTRILRASTKVTPGTHSLHLSIADQGDRQYDSTVLLDRLTLDNRKPCKPGVALDNG